MYIQYTRPMQPITVFKGKVPRVKRAKREEVPEAYRKVKLSTKLKSCASTICLFFVGITELIRKENKNDDQSL